eukprot:SAG11_NODE_2346_length_3487_cov_1.474026_5_plen_69_part_00
MLDHVGGGGLDVFLHELTLKGIESMVLELEGEGVQVGLCRVVQPASDTVQHGVLFSTHHLLQLGGVVL